MKDYSRWGLAEYRLKRWIKTMRIKQEVLNNPGAKRLDWKQMELQGGAGVVKGTARRVIIVKSPDPEIFEEAIFIMREDFAMKKGASSENVVREAQRVADSYIRSSLGKTKKLIWRFRFPAFAAAGAAAAGIAWLAMCLAGA